MARIASVAISITIIPIKWNIGIFSLFVDWFCGGKNESIKVIMHIKLIM